MTAILNENVLEDLRRRRTAGESVKALAAGLPGVTWQKVDKAIRNGLTHGRPGRPGSTNCPAAESMVLTVSAKAGPLTERYRPRSLDAIAAQPGVVKFLKSLAAKPYPVALLFEGETGTGKTSAALALAADLGCRVDQDQLGGVHVIAAGEQTADMVRETYDRMWHTPMFGSGWKVLVVNEADRMAPQTETLWLDRLENLPPRTVVVFTTNYPSKLSQRLRDRCMGLHFESDPTKIGTGARLLLEAIWKAETGKPVPGSVVNAVMVQAVIDGQFSFRRAVQLLQRTLS